jgi:hypothetical protein
MDIPALTAAASDLDRYGIEVLCANWTPMVAMIAEPVARAAELLADAAATDIDTIDTFLKRYYQSQRG